MLVAAFALITVLVAMMGASPASSLVGATPIPEEELLVASPASSTDCTDDSDFRYEGKKCSWVNSKNAKKRKRRCNKTYQDQTISERCRKTCDYNRCRSKNELKVGVYYYPWWGVDFHRGNRPDLYLRSQLEDPPMLPSLGEYDDRNPSVIAKHLKWSRQHNIDLWVTSWWGENRKEDNTTKNVILANKQLRDHKIAIFYETTGRIREKSNYSLDNVEPDLKYLCEQYFNHPNYYQKIDYDENGIEAGKRPIFFVYLTRKLEKLGLLGTVIEKMRNATRDAGCGEIFIVGDQVFQGPPNQNNATKLIPFDILDAVTTYDVYGSLRGGNLDGYVGSEQAVVDYYQEEQKQWKQIAASKNCVFVPGASPGFNDRGVRPEKNRVPLSRRLNTTSEEGSLFRAALQQARTLVDAALDNLIMINSWNEWHEDTQIEPVVASDGSTGVCTAKPTNLTYGLEYKAYGNRYLKIVKQETAKWNVSSAEAAAVATESVVEVSTDGSMEVLDDSQYEEIETISDMIGLELELE